MQILQPPGWARPHGYSNGLITSGRLVFIAGQIGWDGQQQFHSDQFAVQARTALQNILTILAEAGGKPEHMARLNWYVVDKQEYVASYGELGSIYRELMGNHYPVMSAFQVSALMEDRAKVEIEAVAVIPSGLSLQVGR